MNKDQILAIIKDVESKYTFNDYVENFLEIEELEKVTTVEELRELLEKANEDYNITYAEIWGYASAIGYLSENDSSLTESLEIACEYGYSIKDLSSERLASLLKSRRNYEDYAEFIDSVCNLLEN